MTKLAQLTILILLFIAQESKAGLVKTDFLAGAGDFEHCTYVCWWSTYKGSDYSHSANSVYILPDQPGGYSIPTPEQSVADGWVRSTGDNINPAENIEYKISEGTGINGSNCQYFALKNIKSGLAHANLDKHIKVDDSKSFRVHSGDTVTFRIDHIRMSDYSNLPNGATVNYYMRLGSIAPIKELKPSGSPLAQEITAVVPKDVDDINLQVYIRVSGNIATRKPGIYIDGARLFIKRAGDSDYEKRLVPAPRKRSIKTQNVFFHEDWTDIYKAACDYDVVVTHESEYMNIPLLRYFNPNIKIYLSQSGTMCMDFQDSKGKEPMFYGAPLSFQEVRAKHPGWLYNGGVGTGGFVNSTTYPERYYIRITNTEYQSAWARGLIEEAKRLGVDGVWLDDMSASIETRDKDGRITTPGQQAWEVQQFIHAVYPKLKAAGLEITQNAAAIHLNDKPDWTGNYGEVYFDSSWVPSGKLSTSDGYLANSKSATADIVFNEWGFFMPYPLTHNTYSESYWLDCLHDMDRIATWNTGDENNGSGGLTDKGSKKLHIWILGREFPNDHAYGIDGWLNFGLCSFLLGQNEWTYLGCRVEGNNWGISPRAYPDVDYSITQRLGVPDGQNKPFRGDPYVRYRLYKSNGNESAGGVVIVNGYSKEQKRYTTEFDAVDMEGKTVPVGTEITLNPHTGRILLRK